MEEVWGRRGTEGGRMRDVIIAEGDVFQRLLPDSISMHRH